MVPSMLKLHIGASCVERLPCTICPISGARRLPCDSAWALKGLDNNYHVYGVEVRRRAEVTQRARGPAQPGLPHPSSQGLASNSTQYRACTYTLIPLCYREKIGRLGRCNYLSSDSRDGYTVCSIYLYILALSSMSLSQGSCVLCRSPAKEPFPIPRPKPRAVC